MTTNNWPDPACPRLSCAIFNERYAAIAAELLKKEGRHG